MDLLQKICALKVVTKPFIVRIYLNGSLVLTRSSDKLIKDYVSTEEIYILDKSDVEAFKCSWSTIKKGNVELEVVYVVNDVENYRVLHKMFARAKEEAAYLPLLKFISIKLKQNTACQWNIRRREHGGR